MSKTPLDILRPTINNNTDISTNEIVLALLNDDNLDLKTRIDKPFSLTLIMLLSDYLEKHNAKKSCLALEKFKNLLNTFKVSQNGLSRKEVTEILKANRFIEQERNEEIGFNTNLAKLK
ncbi:MAG: hypothetical protein P8Y70_01565 [Candidatus Lokiarchaeota archaeon]